MYVMGVDIGSASSKAVILTAARKMAGQAVVAVGTGSSGPARAVEQCLDAAGISDGELSYVVATGYGRINFPGADKQVSEITCHARGVFSQCPQARTIIDIGGQDSKVITLADNGTVTRFIMNDKCAAGTGRFLEVMARVFEVNVEDMASIAAHATEIVDVSSTCAVFAESEVISRLASGTKTSDIAAGVHQSIARRVAALATRVGIQPEMLITGGVAQNQGIVAALEAELQCNIKVVPFPQLTGALGAALTAYEEVMRQDE